MKTVLIVHGIGGHAGIHWQQWLHDELKKQGYNVLMPDMPAAEHPDRKTWLVKIKKTLNNVDLNELVIVAHSLGVTTALDFIEQSEARVKELVSVSGFAEDYGAGLNSYFLNEKSIDFEKIRAKLDSATVIYSSDDPYVTQEALKYVAISLGVEPIVIRKGGHLNTEAGFTQFPQLLKTIEAIK